MAGPLLNWSDLNYVNYSPASSLNFPSPFLNFENFTVPKSIKELFSYLFHSYLTDSSINPAIEKLASYPITSIVFKSDCTKDEKKIWKKILNKVLDIRNFLNKIALDYLLYGNTLVSLNIPFSRSLRCKTCDEKYVVGHVGVEWEWKNQGFQVHCVKCGLTPADAEDIAIGHIDSKRDIINALYDFRLIRWNIHNVRIDEYEPSGKKVYYYTIPAHVRARVLKGDKDFINDLPMYYIDTIQAHIKKKKKCEIKLDPRKVWGLHRPMPSSPQEGMSGWGLPIAICSLRDIFFKTVMKRAQAVVLNEHIVPFRIISPALEGRDPLEVNLSSWREEVTENVLLWRKNPMHMMTTPIPVNVQQMGGGAKGLMLFPEEEMADNSIIKGIGTPREFVVGGLTWSGSSISLRMLENGLTYLVENSEEIMNGSIEMISEYISLKAVEVGLKPFKAADDIQSRNQLMQLWDRKLCSATSLLENFDMDFDDEMEKFEKEVEKLATIQAKLSVIANKYMAKAQENIQMNQNPRAFDIFQNPMQPDMTNQIVQQMQNMSPEQQQQYLEMMNQKNPAAASAVNESMGMSPAAGLQFMMQNMGLTPDMVVQREQDLQNNDPTQFQIYEMIKGMLGGVNQSPGGNSNKKPGNNQTDMRPMPEQRPPRRTN